MEVTVITAEQLAQWKALADAATPEPWTTERPGADAGTGFAKGVIVAATARGQGIYADPPGGSYPERDRRFIAVARTAVPALAAEVERLRDFATAAVVAFDLAAELMPDNVINFAQFAADARAVLPEGVAK